MFKNQGNELKKLRNFNSILFYTAKIFTKNKKSTVSPANVDFFFIFLNNITYDHLLIFLYGNSALLIH